MTKRHRTHWLAYVILALALYVCISGFVFAVRHPTLTNIQQWQHFWEAMAWQ